MGPSVEAMAVGTKRYAVTRAKLDVQAERAVKLPASLADAHLHAAVLGTDREHSGLGCGHLRALCR